MTVKELIEELEKFDENKDIYLSIGTHYDNYGETVDKEYFEIHDYQDGEITICYDFY